MWFQVRNRLPAWEEHPGTGNGIDLIAPPQVQTLFDRRGKEMNLIYKDQAFIAGKGGEYPEELETYRTTKTGFDIF